MVDVESLVFSKLSSRLRKKFNQIYCTGEYIAAPPKFPCVSIVEEDNSTYQRSMDSEPVEHHSTAMYQIEVFSNLQTGKKKECRDVMSVIDGEMIALGFTRTFSRFIPNYADATIARITARYQGVISQDGMIYRN